MFIRQFVSLLNKRQQMSSNMSISLILCIKMIYRHFSIHCYAMDEIKYNDLIWQSTASPTHKNPQIKIFTGDFILFDIALYVFFVVWLNVFLRLRLFFYCKLKCFLWSVFLLHLYNVTFPCKNKKQKKQAFLQTLISKQSSCNEIQMWVEL